MSASHVAASSPLGESLDDCEPVFGSMALKVRVETGQEKLEPMFPVTVALLVVCSHHASGDVVVSMTE